MYAQTSYIEPLSFFLLSPPFPLRKHNAFDFWLYFSHCCAAHPHGCVALISRWHSYSPAPTESLGFFSQLYLKERRKERKRRKKSRIVHTCHSFFLSLQLCGPASRNPKGIGARGNLGPQWEMGQDVPTTSLLYHWRLKIESNRAAHSFLLDHCNTSFYLQCFHN